MKFFQIIAILLISSFAYGEVDPVDLTKAALKRTEKVPEFAFIQKEARKLGVKVYLFGGTASAFAHYVRWDLEREAGDDKYQKERFDYDFTNIYRGNQDLDIVVDGTAEQAAQLEQILKSEYPHFVGSKDAWEVRLLRAQIGDKLPLLGDEDFRNQHTDTNSTGLLDLTAGENEIVFRDLLDWENPESQFLEDVAKGEIKFLFSKTHETTSRFNEGKNPPIFAAVRYLAKLAQYEVKGTDEDLALIKRTVDETNWGRIKSNSYVKHKLEEFGKKVLLNAPDSEYAWNLLESTGLREKLIEMDGSQTNEETLSWWMNKEPLRSKEIGQGDGKTAKEIFRKKGIKDLIVSHETTSFIAYENITRSSKGKANAFISRNNVNGEAAAFGDGFYTQIGLEGARGTGITIRFRIDPNAREGSDFTYDRSSYLVIKNKKVLTLVQENLDMELIDFIKLLISGDITDKDIGLLNKLTRKFDRKVISAESAQEVREFVASQSLSESNEMSAPALIAIIGSSQKNNIFELTEVIKLLSTVKFQGLNNRNLIMKELDFKAYSKKEIEEALEFINVQFEKTPDAPINGFLTNIAVKISQEAGDFSIEENVLILAYGWSSYFDSEYESELFKVINEQTQTRSSFEKLKKLIMDVAVNDPERFSLSLGKLITSGVRLKLMNNFKYIKSILETDIYIHPPFMGKFLNDQRTRRKYELSKKIEVATILINKKRKMDDGQLAVLFYEFVGKDELLNSDRIEEILSLLIEKGYTKKVLEYFLEKEWDETEEFKRALKFLIQNGKYTPKQFILLAEKGMAVSNVEVYKKLSEFTQDRSLHTHLLKLMKKSQGVNKEATAVKYKSFLKIASVYKDDEDLLISVAGNFYGQIKNPLAPKVIERLMSNKKGHSKLIKEYFVKYPSKSNIKYLKQIFNLNTAEKEFIDLILTSKEWLELPEIIAHVKKLAKEGKKDREIIYKVLSVSHLDKSLLAKEVMPILIQRESNYFDIFTSLLRNDMSWITQPGAVGWLDTIYSSLSEESLSEVVSNEEWIRKYPRAAEILEHLITGVAKKDRLRYVFINQSAWTEHERGAELLIKFIKSGNHTVETINNILFPGFAAHEKKERWLKHPQRKEILEAIFDLNKKEYAGLILDAVRHNYGVDLKESIYFVDKIFKKYIRYAEFLTGILRAEKFSSRTRSRWFRQMIQQYKKTKNDGYLHTLAFSMRVSDFKNMPQSLSIVAEFIDVLLSSELDEDNISTIDQALFGPNNSWAENLSIQEYLGSEKVSFDLFVKKKNSFSKWVRLNSRMSCSAVLGVSK